MLEIPLMVKRNPWNIINAFNPGPVQLCNGQMISFFKLFFAGREHFKIRERSIKYKQIKVTKNIIVFNKIKK